MKFALFFLIAIGFTQKGNAAPSQVVLIRHAEKPDSGDTLSEQGFQRAAALVPFFTAVPHFAQIDDCAALYAPCSSKNHKATRCIQTVSALANSWQVPFYVRYTVGDLKLMAQEIMSEPAYDGKMVLICWEHSHIPPLAEIFGVNNPPAWPDDVFDRVWIINFAGSKVVSFQNLPQRLMYGDSLN